MSHEEGDDQQQQQQQHQTLRDDTSTPSGGGIEILDTIARNLAAESARSRRMRRRTSTSITRSLNNSDSSSTTSLSPPPPPVAVTSPADATFSSSTVLNGGPAQASVQVHSDDSSNNSRRLKRTATTRLELDDGEGSSSGGAASPQPRRNVMILHDDRNDINVVAPEPIPARNMGGDNINAVNEPEQPQGPIFLPSSHPQFRAQLDAEAESVRRRIFNGQGLISVRDFMVLDYQSLLREREQGRILPVPPAIQWNNINRGITEEVIMRHIKHEVIGEVTPGLGNAEVCPICLDEFVEGAWVGSIDCGHRFHVECIKLWLIKKNKCPLCKRRGLVGVPP